MTPNEPRVPNTNRDRGRAGSVQHVIITWLVLVSAGMAGLMHYSFIPTSTSHTTAAWPVGSQIACLPEHYRLVMFVHPFCPCSTASLRELERLISKSPVPLCTTVVFAAEDVDWKPTQSGLWATANSTAQFRTTCDDRLFECGKFNAKVSGEVFLYDPEGEFLFHGGLTDSRGHEGDSEGKAAILGRLRGPITSSIFETPVFGCELRNPTT